MTRCLQLKVSVDCGGIGLCVRGTEIDSPAPATVSGGEKGFSSQANVKRSFTSAPCLDGVVRRWASNAQSAPAKGGTYIEWTPRSFLRNERAILTLRARREEGGEASALHCP